MAFMPPSIWGGRSGKLVAGQDFFELDVLIILNIPIKANNSL
jgi:hypothetical protein